MALLVADKMAIFNNEASGDYADIDVEEIEFDIEVPAEEYGGYIVAGDDY